jgi:site-specific recombinase XerD
MPRDRQLRVPEHPATPLDLCLDLFITAKEAERCTPRTIETYRATLVRFCDWLRSQSTQEAREITPHLIRLFLASLEKHGYAASYIHIHARVIKTWIRFLNAEELIPTDPMRKVAMSRLDKTILPGFTTEDVKRLLSS